MVADAVGALVEAVEAAHSATLMRIELDRGVMQLRDDLWGVAPGARKADYDDLMELWRILMALPTKWLDEIRAHHDAGGRDIRELGQSLIRRADAA